MQFGPGQEFTRIIKIAFGLIYISPNDIPDDAKVCRNKRTSIWTYIYKSKCDLGQASNPPESSKSHLDLYI